MLVSIETPVFKGGWLRPCIHSVLYQSSPHWRFSLLWDGGDEESRRILEELDRRNHPNVEVYFGENRGIAGARRFLTDHSDSEFVLPLDDDDVLPFYAVERFLSVVNDTPWSAVVRAQRKIIDEKGEVIDTPPWFPFEPRHYQHGMVTDLLNHTQPYLIRRSAYDRTTGWEGFEDFSFAGEDCDIYLKLEEVGTIELLDEVLYYYRVHSRRASLDLTDEAAYEMWRRLADKTIARIGLPLRRVNQIQPFQYQRRSRSEPTLDMLDFVIVGDGGVADSVRSHHLARILRRAGVSADALHCVTRSGREDLNQGFARTTRPLVCFVDSSLDVDGASRLRTFLRLMIESDADLAAPKLVAEDGSVVFANPGFTEEKRPELRSGGDEGDSREGTGAPWLCEKLVIIRREVLKATGGFDEGYERDRTAMVDLCLKARQRDFKCVYLGGVAFTLRDPEPSRSTEADLSRLHRKWVGYPDLFERGGRRE